MGFSTGSYAKVWEVKPSDNGKYTDIQISISRKSKEGNDYETTFSGYVRLIGTANDQAKKLTKGDRIKLGSVDVENRYNKETKVSSYYPKVFSFEMADGAKPSSRSSSNNPAEGDDEPF